MKISIIIPTFNEEEYLPKLLESIQKQSFTDYEVIIADGDSQDETVNIAKEYNCKIVKGGLPAVGRNNGAKVAEGELLVFLDSDLILTENYLENLVKEFEEKEIDIGISQMIPLSNKFIYKIAHKFCNYFLILIEKIKPHGAGCYGIISKKSLHEKVNGFDESVDFGEDTDYIERIGKISKFKVLRNVKLYVSTRRLEEEGLWHLIKTYGKSTINDFRGKRTSASELNYGFNHNKKLLSENNLPEIKQTTDLVKRKKIFYCVCGEGMGHAIRTGVIVEELEKKYDIYLFAGDRAYKYLDNKFKNVFEIGVFNSVYEDNQIKNKKTFVKGLKENPENIKLGYKILYKQYHKIKPCIIVSDFENYSNVLSNLLNIPLISIDNIHMITQTAIDYPSKHKIDMLKAKTVIKFYIYNPKIHILTSFFFPPVREGKNAVIYPPVLRKEILELNVENKGHVFVYQTSNCNYKLIEQLKQLNEKFIVYGFNEDGEDENVRFRSFNEDVFFDDLRTSKAIITNGGFTLISEAIYLKKPIFSIPVIGQFEQTLNGFYIEKLGFGEYHEDMSNEKIENFLKNLPKYEKNLAKNENSDNTGIISKLEESIEKFSKDYSDHHL